MEDVESEIYGTVTDDKGAKLPGVSVTLNSTLSASRSVTSDPNGEFRFDHVKKGNYSVQFALEGFGELKKNAISIQFRKPVELMAKLQPSTVQELVVVGETPIGGYEKNRHFHLF